MNKRMEIKYKSKFTRTVRYNTSKHTHTHTKRVCVCAVITKQANLFDKLYCPGKDDISQYLNTM